MNSNTEKQERIIEALNKNSSNRQVAIDKTQ